MRRLSTDTFPRPEDVRGDTPTALYVRSYLLTRTVVGVVGVALGRPARDLGLLAERGRRHGGGMGRVQPFRGCGIAILVAVAWIAVGGLLGLDLAGLTPLYLGEVACAYAFGLGWFVSGADLWRRTTRGAPGWRES